MQTCADRLGVKLRPHLKTLKSALAAEALIAAGASGITVSTLKEADYFNQHGITDITYAVGMVPTRLADAASLRAAGAYLKIMTDNREVARALAAAAAAGESSTPYKLLIEIGGLFQRRHGDTAGTSSDQSLGCLCRFQGFQVGS
jgi:D-serine deaminase-like pyridoxal phosphate-dependent protein